MQEIKSFLLSKSSLITAAFVAGAGSGILGQDLLEGPGFLMPESSIDFVPTEPVRKCLDETMNSYDVEFSCTFESATVDGKSIDAWKCGDAVVPAPAQVCLDSLALAVHVPETASCKRASVSLDGKAVSSWQCSAFGAKPASLADLPTDAITPVKRYQE